MDDYWHRIFFTVLYSIWTNVDMGCIAVQYLRVYECIDEASPVLYLHIRSNIGIVCTVGTIYGRILTWYVRKYSV